VKRLDPVSDVATILRDDPTLTVSIDSLGSVRSCRQGVLVGVVDMRDGRMVYAEHDGILWSFWPHDSDEKYEEQVASWTAWARGVPSKRRSA